MSEHMPKPSGGLSEPENEMPMDQEAQEADLEDELPSMVGQGVAATAAVPAVIEGAPITLAEDIGAEPPRKLPFEECYKTMQDMGFALVPAPELRYVPPSGTQAADFLDLSLTRTPPAGSVTHAFHVRAGLDNSLEFDVSQIKPALSSGDFSLLPELSRPTVNILTQCTMDVHIILSGAGQKVIIKHMNFESPVSPAWVKRVFEVPGEDTNDYVLFGSRGQTHPKVWPKVTQYML